MESVTEPPAGATPEPEAAAPAAPAGTPCRSCSAPLAGGQEWCLACGAARHPAHLYAGRRPFLATVGATIALLGVAAAASYAAVIDQAPVIATATVPAPLPPVVATTPTTVTPTTTTPTTTTPSTPATTPTYTPPYTPPSSYVPPATPYVPPSSSTTTTNTTTTNTTTTPTVPPITVIPVKDTTPDAYDPYHQLLPPLSDPADAIGTSIKQPWSALTDPGTDPAAPKSMQVGLMISVDAKTALQELTFLTDTPGFTVQVYGSADTTPPPEITHGWTNLGQRSSVDAKKAKNDPKGDGRVRVDFGNGDKFRHILLWFTTPPPVKNPTTPPAPSQVNIAKLRLYK